jgi:hypothetical protein
VELFAVSMNLELLIWPILVMAAFFGVLAIVSPTLFRRMSESGSQWFDTNKLISILDTPINIDKAMLRYSRAFGLAVVASSLFLGYLFIHRFHGGNFGL